MSFPRYEKYKDSGVEWSGQVPEHWEVWKLSNVVRQIGSGTTPNSGNTKYYEDGEIAWLNTGDLNDGELFDCLKRVTDLAVADHSSLKIYPSGSTVIAMYGATIGKLAVLRFPATVNQACCVFSGGSRLISKFLFYWLLSLREHIVSLATGGGQPNINQEILRSLQVVCSDIDEQSVITDFLDRETSKIDALVAEQEKLIALPKEKREAVITHAVTKGLDPTVPMKDSGIEWLGDVPEHWALTRFRFVAQLNPSKSETVHLPREAQVTFIPMEAISDDGALNLAQSRTIADVISGYTYFRDGDVTVAKITPCFENGKGAVMRGLVGGIGFGTSELIVVRPIPNIATSDYLYLVFMSTPFRSLGESFMYGAGGQKRVPDNFVRNFAQAFPSLSEQLTITAFLENENRKIDQLVAEAQRAIALLKERRRALISAAVTGKVDVRGLVREEVTA